jgi:hypothetical protein
MPYIFHLLETTLDKVLLAFAHNWIYLLASILVGLLIKLFLDKNRRIPFLSPWNNTFRYGSRRRTGRE